MPLRRRRWSAPVLTEVFDAEKDELLKIWARKLHPRPLPLSLQEREFVEAAIGRKLIEKQLEFSRGSGRKPGSKDKKPRKPENEMEPASIRKRTYRDNKARDEEHETRKKEHAKRTATILAGFEYFQLELDPPEAVPSGDGSNAPIEPVDLYDERFEFKNYYSGDIGYNDDIRKEVEADDTWYAERCRQKRERWLARPSGPIDK